MKQSFHGRPQQGFAVAEAPSRRMDGDVSQLTLVGNEPQIGIGCHRPVVPFQDVIAGDAVIEFSPQGLVRPGGRKGRLFNGDDVRQVLKHGPSDRY